MRVLIVVPALNEERTIVRVLDQVKKASLGSPDIEKKIVVVDDGSTDATAALVRTHFPEIPLLQNITRCGKGSAVARAVREMEADYVLVQDADLEYDPADYPALMAPILAGDARVVYGSRFLKREYPRKMLKMNYLGNRLGTLLTNCLYGSHLTDLMTCYKLVPRELLLACDIDACGFELCPEITATVLNRGIRICEVPIGYHGRSKKEGKKIVLRDSWYIFTALVRNKFVKH